MKKMQFFLEEGSSRSFIPFLLLLMVHISYAQKDIQFESNKPDAIAEVRNMNPLGFAGYEFYNDMNSFLYVGLDGSGYLGNPKGAYFWSDQDIYVGSPLRLILKANGNIGIGSTILDPTAQLHTSGSVRFENFGAGSLQTDANGNLMVSSDRRLKEIGKPFERGLDEILSIQPVYFRWKKETGFDSKNDYVGFVAQDIQKQIPEAVSVDNRKHLTLSDRAIIAALVNAIKELKIENETLREAITDIQDRLCDSKVGHSFQRNDKIVIEDQKE